MPAGSALEEFASNWGFKDITTSKGLTAPAQPDRRCFMYSVNYHLGGHLGIFQFGGKVRNAHKFQNATETVYDGWNAATVIRCRCS